MYLALHLISLFRKSLTFWFVFASNPCIQPYTAFETGHGSCKFVFVSSNMYARKSAGRQHLSLHQQWTMVIRLVVSERISKSSSQHYDGVMLGAAYISVDFFEVYALFSVPVVNDVRERFFSSLCSWQSKVVSWGQRNFLCRRLDIWRNRCSGVKRIRTWVSVTASYTSSRQRKCGLLRWKYLGLHVSRA